MMLFGRLARIALALALLAGWQAALRHPIEHVDGLGAFVHVHGGHSHDEDSGSEPLCDALAALTACAVQPGIAFEGSRSDFQAPEYPVGAPRVAEAPPFLSQGPPAPV
jgi:hypothetical protein